MNEDAAELAAELRRHLAWQEGDGSKQILKDPTVAKAAPAIAKPAPASAPRVDVPGGKTLDEVRRELGDCKRCKLSGGRKQIVFGTGNPKAELVFVGEAPGEEEDLQGVPFVGKAGQLLTKMIEAMKLKRDDVYICNVVKCRPPGNRNPEPDEIAACEPFLKAQLAALRPKVIVALGKFAAQTLLRDQTAITRMRGQWREYEGIPLMPTFHPAYLLRVPSEKKLAWADLQEVMKKLGEDTMMKGTVTLHPVFGGSLEGNPLGDGSTRTTPVYLPPGYAEAPQARFPVVYFLHGFTGSGVSWLNASPFTRNVPERLDALIASSSIPPCIGVFVDGWTALGGSQWINSEGIGQYRNYVARDIVGWVDRTFRTVARGGGRALVGKSSGGYGALVISRFHPDIFAHVGVHSGDSGFEYCYLHELPQALGPLSKAGGIEPWFREFKERAAATKMRGDDHAVINMLAMSAAYSPKKNEPLGIELPVDLATGRLKIEVWNRWLVHDPVRFVPKHLDVYKKLKSLFLDCGTRDEFNLRWGTRIIADELKQGGVELLHEEFEDGHMQVNYRFDRSLQYLAPRLDRA